MRHVLAFSSGVSRVACQSLVQVTRRGTIIGRERWPVCDCIDSTVPQSSFFSGKPVFVKHRHSSRGRKFYQTFVSRTEDVPSPMSILEGVGDMYQGVAVSPEHLPDCPDEFAERLKTSLKVEIQRPDESACMFTCFEAQNDMALCYESTVQVMPTFSCFAGMDKQSKVRFC